MGLFKYFKYVFLLSIPFLIMNFIMLVYISNKLIEVVDLNNIVYAFIMSAIVFILPSYYLLAFKIGPLIKFKPVYMNEDGKLEDEDGNIISEELIKSEKDE